MVAVFAGVGLGLERGSALVLGGAGQLGQARLGRSGDSVYVNAASGNLVVQNTDEMLFGLGPDNIINRTYNSQTASDPNWQRNLSRRVTGLTGTLGQAGSTIKRIAWDGSDVVYSWDGSAYVAREGGGGYDRLALSGSIWTWTDGASQVVETYDNANGGRILSSTDIDGNQLTYSYNAAGQLTRVSTANATAGSGYTDLVYSGALLTSIVTRYAEGGVDKTMTRVSYGYDGSGRLTTVSVDLTPTNTADNQTYVTTYGYDGTSNRVASISQSDGSSLLIDYTNVGGGFRVTRLRELAASGVTRETNIAYNIAARVTTITDPLGQATQLAYDVAGQLLSITTPAPTLGSPPLVTSFTYNSMGDVLEATAPDGSKVTYTYNAQGLLTQQVDGAGNTVSRTYGSRNELLTETRYLVAKQSALAASAPATTRFIYDGKNHLRFVVGAEGDVTEYRYNAAGLQTSAIQYVGARYDISALAETASIAESTLAAWAAGADKLATQRTDTTYDFRGNVSKVTAFEKTLADGTGDASGQKSETLYVYDHAGRLISRQPLTATAAEVMVYDGLGRLISTTDFAGKTTSIAFNDAANAVVVTLANGLVQTSTYNKAGELVSYSEGGVGVATATTAYTYDSLGRLRLVQDSAGRSVHSLYDSVGRKLAEISPDGAVVEFKYDANDRLMATVRYGRKLTAAQQADLLVAGVPTSQPFSVFRPAADAADRWDWRIYDQADRLIQTIDATGAAVVYAYDGASRLISKISYARLLSPAALSGFKTTLPTSVQSPTASATEDRVTRYFYDRDGRRAGALDAEGYLSQTKYDAAGQVIEVIDFANAAASALRAAGTLAELIGSVGTSARDIHTWNLYDGRGLLRASIDGVGGLTRYSYDAAGDVSSMTVGQKVGVTGFLTTPPTLAGLPAPAGNMVLETTTYARNAFGLVTSEVRSLAAGGSETTTYVYDDMRRLVTTTKAAGSGDARTFNQVYDLRGRLIGSLTGRGSAALAALGANPSQAQVDLVYRTYGVIYSYDAGDRLISMREPSGVGDGGRTRLYYYDDAGRLAYEVNAAGEVRQYVYNAFGERADEVLYGAAIAPTALAALVSAGGGAVTSALTNAITSSAANDSKTHYDYDVMGRLSGRLNALLATTSLSYNAFGELVSQLDPISGGTNVQTTWTYDRRGLVRSEMKDVASGGLRLETTFSYDAFRRALQIKNAGGQIRATAYDPAGQVVRITDALGQVTTYTYDGRGNLISLTDRTGKTTTYAYDAFARQITTTTPEGFVIVRRVNAYGQTISLTDGAGRQTSYGYDLDGNLISVTDGAGNQTKAVFDTGGRLIRSEDERAIATSYAYDAAGRVFTSTLDPAGLNLTTAYAYDAKGQQIEVTDAAGLVTQISYDLAGRRTQVVVDPAGQALTTQYEYDLADRVLQVVEAAGSSAARTTQHVYDKAGRLTQSIVDPGAGKLNLTTTYAYNANGQVVARTDPAGATTRFVYDAEGRLIYTVDAVGAVTQTTYDGEGRVLTVRGLAQVVAAGVLAGWPLAVSAAQVASGAGASTSDRLVNHVYDGDGRLRYSLDANLRVTEYAYDGAGALTRTTQYAGSIAASASYSLAYVQGQIVSSGLGALTVNRITRHVYGAAGRLAFSIDAVGTVTRFVYDLSGALIKTTLYASLYTASGDPTRTAMEIWAANNAGPTDRVTRTVYDTAGRAAYSVDAEGYVTKQVHDAAGRTTSVVRYGASYTVGDGVTAAGLASLIGAPAGAATTSYIYDAAGRLIETIDALGVRTRLTLDAMGQVTDRTGAYGTSGASTTRAVFDKAGRVLSQTRAHGKAEATTTSYTYDGQGRVLTIIDGAGYVTSHTYDAMGRVLTTTTPILAGVNAVTTYVYDAFGSKVQVTDPRGYSGFFYYDLLGRLTLQIDPEGYATATSYGFGGETASVTRYALRTSGTPTTTTAPTIVTAANDATTSFTRDKLGRLTGLTDAQGHAESYELNAFGDQTRVTNKLGGVTTNTFDRRGLLLSETLPIASVRSDGTLQAASVTNTYAYDARGNRTQMVEAAGLSEARTTTYAYDLLDRVIAKTGDAFPALSGDLVTIGGWAADYQTWTYDARGNVIEHVRSGARTLTYYDALNRKSAELDMLGTMSAWTYDANGNVLTQKTYGDFVTLPASPGGAPPAPVNPGSHRLVSYGYDRAGRLTSTTIAGVRVGYYNGSTYQSSTVSITTYLAYDAAGNLIETVDGNAMGTYFYYDKLGRKIGQVDPGRYLTTYVLNKDGNVQTETCYATPLAPGFSRTTLPSVSASSDDRTTVSTYDNNGRLLTTTRLNVGAWSTDGSGGLLAAAPNATISYTYNGLGQVTTKTEATGEQFIYAYDLAGRHTASAAPARLNAEGLSVQQITENYYDGVGNMTRSRVGPGALPTINDRVTLYNYAYGGKLISVTDPGVFTQTYSYGAQGRVNNVTYQRLMSDGTSVTEAVLTHFDWLGRTTQQAVARNTGGTWIGNPFTQYLYNAYGDLRAKGVAGQWQEQYDYDASGRMWRSNAGDGVTKLYIYNGNGALTLTISSSGTNLRFYATLDQAIAELTNHGANAIGELVVSGVVVTINVLDGRDQVVEVREPLRELTQGGPLTLVSHKKAYNAFGEVVLETNAIGGQTQYAYNTQGKLVSKQQLGLQHVDHWGVAYGVGAETYRYDLSGRLVATTDAGGALVTRQLLAGTGYGEDEALVSREFYLGEGSSKSYGYDVFGNLRTLTDELGRKEERVYDRMGRLIYQVLPQRADGQQMVNMFSYDGLGQRLRHEYYWGFTSHGLVATTDYDGLGRVSKTVDFGGAWTEYYYTWEASLSSEGLGQTGGWIITSRTTKGDNIEHQDYFGRTLKKIEVGGVDGIWTNPDKRTTNFGYDAAGRLYAEWMANVKSLNYAYFNTGRVKTITGEMGVAVTTFGYDAEGNQTAERLQHGQGVPHKNATSSYDAHGRRIGFTDTTIDGTSVSITYAYTATNDVRKVSATYYDIGGVNPIVRTSWFNYDSRNRLVVSNGDLINGVGVARGERGTTISYDQAGQRITSSTVAQTGGLYFDRTERYSYTADGYLSQVDIDENGAGFVTRALDVRDILGRVTLHREFDEYGSTVYERSTTYDNRSRIVSENSYNRNSSGALVGAEATYEYDSNHGYLAKIYTNNYLNGAYQNHTLTDYGYLLWDDVKQSTIQSTTLGVGGSTTTFVYDENGKVSQVVINDTRPRTISLVNDATGQAISRTETVSGSQVRDRYYVFGGMRMGQVGDNGPVDLDYASEINNRRLPPLTGPLGSRPFADFAQNYEPISPSSTAQTSSRYTVRDGDTLRTVARNLWGDEALWYVLAEANGLTNPDALAAGMVLVVPNQVINAHHKSSTFRVFDPGDVLGQVQPNAPTPAANNKKKGCGGLGQILMVIVAVVVAAYVAPWAAGQIASFGAQAGATATGAAATAAAASTAGATATATISTGAQIAGAVIGGAAGGIASQGVGIAMGVQDRFSWKGVALSAIAGGVGGGLKELGAFSSLGNRTMTALVRSATGNVITQGVGMATGLQNKFDWTSVAVSALSAGVADLVGQTAFVQGLAKGASALSVRGLAAAGISNTAGAIAGSAARSLVEGSDFGDNLMSAIPDVIGMTIGNAMAGRIKDQASMTDVERRYGKGAFQLADSGQIANNASGPVFGGAGSNLSLLGGHGSDTLKGNGFWGDLWESFKGGVGRLFSLGDQTSTASSASYGAPEASGGNTIEELVVSPLRKAAAKIFDTRLFLSNQESFRSLAGSVAKQAHNIVVDAPVALGRNIEPGVQRFITQPVLDTMRYAQRATASVEGAKGAVADFAQLVKTTAVAVGPAAAAAPKVGLDLTRAQANRYAGAFEQGGIGQVSVMAAGDAGYLAPLALASLTPSGRVAELDELAMGAAAYARSPRNPIIAAESAGVRGVSAVEGFGSNTGLYRVGPYNEIRGTVPGLDAHHVGQKALLGDMIPGYDPLTAPSILVPKVGHTIRGPNGIVSRSVSGLTTPRQVVARDIMELRRVYPDIPNARLQELINMNKTQYPQSFTRGN